MADDGERIVVWQRAGAQGGHAALAAWSKQVADRFTAAGGGLLAHLSGTVVVEFPPGDVGDAVEVALDLLDDAEDASVSVAFGVALGPLTSEGGVPTSAAIEAAESLAVRARSGEVLLDPRARDRARGLFLFGRTVGGGAQSSRAASIDRTHPRRDTATAAISRLGTVPITPATQALLPTLVGALASPEPPVVLLRGPVGAGAAELVRVARSQLAPAALVELGAATGGIAPLGSVRSALVRDAGLQMLVLALDDRERAPLEAVQAGQLAPHEPLRHALATAIDRAGGRVWFLLSPLVAMDAATLAVVAALKRAIPTLGVVARVGVDTPLPPELDDLVDRIELTLPPLRTSDARVVAQAVLGEATPVDVARRVAVLGGDTPASVVEAARAMIGAGDLVLDAESEDRRFVWRSAPRGGVKAIALDALLAERLDQLDDESRRVLELVASMPEWAPRSMLDALASADGLRPRAVPRGLDRLGREGWLTSGEMPKPASSFVRRFVTSASPPARIAEIHRFVADLVAPSPRVAELAERALHQLLGGRESDGAAQLLDAADALALAGYPGGAAQLALVVLGSDVGGEARVRAERIVAASPRRSAPVNDGTVEPPSVELALDLPDLEERPSAPSVRPLRIEPSADASAPPSAPTEVRALDDDAVGTPTPATGLVPSSSTPDDDGIDEESQLRLELREAIRRRDFDALDRLAERAIAVGSDMQAVARIRAIAAALRGDLAGAQQRLDRMRRGSDGPRDRRALIAEAMIALRAGRPMPATRLALRALADARRASDERGEAVALFTLAACYRAAGRTNDAALLEARADA